VDINSPYGKVLRFMILIGIFLRVAHMEEMRNADVILVGNIKGRDHLEDLGIDGRIILE
jgi:hypothetical protein